jgi:outer membrane protein assembly factor BamB
MTGNTVEKFNTMGVSQGAVGSGYNCAPHAIVFDAADTAYVGQAGCAKSLLKFPRGMSTPTEYPAAEDVQGVFWIDLAPDGCTLFYTSYGPNVKRIDGCTGGQLPDFNAAPLPGGVGHDLRVLPDGNVLVSSGDVIARLDAAGTLVRTYAGPPAEAAYWVGLDLVGDGTFWVGNYFTSNVYRFDLATGAIVASFNTGTPGNSVVGVRVKR